MIVQIYEVATPAEALALGAMGVDHIGSLVGEGSFPREQTIEKETHGKTSQLSQTDLEARHSAGNNVRITPPVNTLR